jgi:hypothetical protein
MPLPDEDAMAGHASADAVHRGGTDVPGAHREQLPSRGHPSNGSNHVPVGSHLI